MIDIELIQACKRQDRIAQKMLYTLLLPKLYATCKQYVTEHTDIEDILSEAFVSIFTKIEQLTSEAAIVSWARKITVNQCLAFLRQRKTFETLSDDYKDAEPIHQPESRDIFQLVNHLPEHSRLVFNLAVVEGYSHKEIAVLLQISEGTSKSQLHYAKSKLKHWLSKIAVL